MGTYFSERWRHGRHLYFQEEIKTHFTQVALKQKCRQTELLEVGGDADVRCLKCDIAAFER